MERIWHLFALFVIIIHSFCFYLPFGVSLVGLSYHIFVPCRSQSILVALEERRTYSGPGRTRSDG